MFQQTQIAFYILYVPLWNDVSLQRFHVLLVPVYLIFLKVQTFLKKKVLKLFMFIC